MKLYALKLLDVDNGYYSRAIKYGNPHIGLEAGCFFSLQAAKANLSRCNADKLNHHSYEIIEFEFDETKFKKI